MPAPSSKLTFGDYRLDLTAGRLSRGDDPIPLPPKAFALLHYLAERPDRLVSKKELLDAVWPGVYVGDGVLKTTIRDIRRAIGDDSHTPRFIETAHRRGYRFVAAVTGETGEASAPAPPPRVRYARSGSVNIAYQVVGDGPVDLVFVMGWVSHLECFWSEPSFARFLHHLASRTRLILFDKRGTGLSDAVPLSQLPTLEQRLDDVRAVMEAVGSERAVLMGVSEGGPLCSLFAATYPQRTEALVMIGSYARRLQDVDYPWGPTREAHARFCQMIVDDWGGPVGLDERAPSKIDDPVFRDWWSSYLRLGASPGAAVALTRMNAEIDVRALLPSVRVPTLVLHRTGDRCLRVEEGRYLASRIPGATFVELPGDDHLPFVGDQDAMLAEIDRFLSRAHVRPEAERMLASVLTLKWESGSRSHVDATIGPIFDRAIASARGQRLVLGDDRLVAAFDGPGRAVTCGTTLIDAARQSGIAARGAVHIGERLMTDRDDPIVELSGRMADVAAPHELYVSRTIVDLLPGSGLRFEGRGLLRTSPADAIGVMAVVSPSITPL